jgi:hypothetical protein
MTLASVKRGRAILAMPLGCRFSISGRNKLIGEI